MFQDADPGSIVDADYLSCSLTASPEIFELVAVGFEAVPKLKSDVKIGE
jgi:hypothetical protein